MLGCNNLPKRGWLNSQTAKWHVGCPDMAINAQWLCICMLFDTHWPPDPAKQLLHYPLELLKQALYTWHFLWIWRHVHFGLRNRYRKQSLGNKEIQSWAGNRTGSCVLVFKWTFLILTEKLDLERSCANQRGSGEADQQES